MSCDFKGDVIRHNRCVDAQTNNVEDKPLYCRDQNITSSCGGPGFCGCPVFDQICCNLEGGCEGGSVGTGECYLQGQERFEKNITVEENVTITRGEVPLTVIEQVGCIFNTTAYSYNLGDGICLNALPSLYEDGGLFSTIDPAFHNLFASQCVCSLLEPNVFDKDGDGYDDKKQFQGGSDCNDTPGIGFRINPGETESCEDPTGFDGIDNNCDGVVDLKCKDKYNKDGDDYYDSSAPFYTAAYYSVRGLKGGDCDDTNGNINPGIVESCSNDYGFDGIDNDCDPNTPQPSCDCRDGTTRIINGICENGVDLCVNGQWTVQSPAVNQCDPSVIIHGRDAIGDVRVPSGRIIKVRASFICQDDVCENINVEFGRAE